LALELNNTGRRRSVSDLACLAVVAIVATICVVPLSPASAETLRVGGTGAAEEILRKLGGIFEAHHGTEIKMLPYLGSDLAVIARPLSQAETDAGLRVALGGYTPFVLVTSWRSPADLRSVDLARLYASADPKWKDGTPIRIILRPQFDSDTTLMARFFPQLGDALAAARRRPEIAVAGSDDDNADLAAETYGSLTASTFLQIASEKRPLRFVSIDGREPSLEGVETGQYPYRKQLDIVIKHPTSSQIDQFIGFLRSAQARQLMRDVGLGLKE
jgi:phosphate transport system substrate-binding protein